MSIQPAQSSEPIRRRSLLQFASLLAAGVTLPPIVATAQSTTRVSVSSAGAQGSWFSFDCATSGDGRFVAFQSSATNLVAGDTNAFPDIFVRDIWNGTTERVSVSTSGTQGDGGSIEPFLSADGRYVVFMSYAATLVAGDTNVSSDIFVRDRQLGTTQRVSVAAGGGSGNANSFTPSISNDGRYVTFSSDASNLVAGDTNARTDVFVYDRSNGTTVCASVSSAGVQGAEPSQNSAISGDRRFVVYQSYSANLAAPDPNGTVQDIFLRDLVLNTTAILSVGFSNGGGGIYPTISADGRFVAFQSDSGDHVAGDTNFGTDVFVRDRLLGVIERASVASGGGEGNAGGDDASISSDGRYVAFSSWSSNLVAGDTNAWKDVFVHDRLTGSTERMNVTTSGVQSNNQGNLPSISGDGRFVAFESVATNLVAGDTNGSVDVFLRDRTGPPPPLPFCFGDGTGTACPCGVGASGAGCPSSLNPSGAVLSATGNASIASDTLVLSGAGMPNSTALYFQGTSQANGGLGSVFGDGLRCTGGATLRLGVEVNTAGSSHYPAGADLPVSVRGMHSAGNVRTYQIWYRNAAAFCAPESFNLTNGVQVVWSP